MPDGDREGGSGKSALAANLAGAFALDGATVLAADVDPQGGLTAALGVDPGKPTLYEVINDQARPEEAARQTAVRGLSLLPADIDLAGAELELPERGRWHDALRRAIGRFAARHDVTLLDTPPGAGGPLLRHAARRGRRHRRLPARVHGLPRPDPRAPDGGPRRHAGDRHRADHGAPDHPPCRRSPRELARTYPQLLLPAIPHRVAVQEAALTGLPLAAPRPDVSAAFSELAKQVKIQRFGGVQCFLDAVRLPLERQLPDLASELIELVARSTPRLRDQSHIRVIDSRDPGRTLRLCRG